MTMSTTPAFLSAPSANALISELRPTTLSQPALQHINALIDEILHLLISSSESLNPTHIRKDGIAAVFNADKLSGDSTGPRALGRSAVAEAELELRSWYESHPGAKRGAFAPEGQGTGVKGARAFPVKEATELLKLKCVSFSTLAPTTPPSEAYEFQVTEAWKAVGGDVSENTLSPSGLWVTAILEHVCEHVLRQLSRVVARDSSIAVAGVQDLYVALCEDESIWGLFKRLQVKESLESAIKAGTRRKNAIPHSQSQNLLGSSIHSKTSIPTSTSLRDTSIDQSRHSSSTPVEHIVNHPSKGPVAAVARAVSSSSKSHHRTPSTLSNNTKNLVTAFQDQYDNDNQRRPSADEDEFDALVRSGETMKVSLTPSRLKNFDMSPNRRAPASPTQSKYVRAVRPTQSPEIQETGTMVPPLPIGLGIDPSKKQMHSRSSSGQRLVARNAATIKEHENEEDEELLDGPNAKKESLADMFASEPKEKNRRSSGGNGKRVVPAVVLGSPPPQEPPTSRDNDESIGRKTKRTDLLVNTVPQQGSVRSTSTARATSKPRGRSEAQELADFFSSTEPPPDTLAPPSPVHEEPPKSAKSFKSFMSRMTGKKVSKENERPPMPSAFPQAPSTDIKRQKSFGSFKSNPASPPLGNAESFSPMMNTSNSFTSPAPAPSPPDRGVSSFASPPITSPPERTSSYNTPTQPDGVSPKNRGVSTSNTTAQLNSSSGALHAAGNAVRSGGVVDADKALAIGVAAMSMGAGTQTQAVSSEKRMDEMAIDPSADKIVDKQEEAKVEKEEKEAVVSRDIGSAAVNASTGQMPAFTTFPPPRPPRATETSQRSFRPVVNEIPVLAPPISTAADEYVVVNRSDAMPTPIITDSARELGLSSPSRPTPSTAAQSHFASDAVSFRTASEGTTPPQQEVTGTHEGVSKPDHVQQVPSIPVSELIPLRGLLQHATSARECQLLLGAILSQLGVPHSDSSQDEVIDPESRVTAWLLAGREGPIDYPSIQSPRSTTATGTSQSQALATPTLTYADLDVGKVDGNEQEGRDAEAELGRKVDENVGKRGEETESWVGAVRIPGDEESKLVREEVMGA